MKLLHIQRKRHLIQRIYNFNFALPGNSFYTDSNDIWLQIIINPGLAALLDQVMVFMILKDDNISINGSAIEQLTDYFSNREIRNGLSAMHLDITVPRFDLSFLRLKDWKIQLHYLILSNVYAHKSQAINERLLAVLNLPHDFVVMDELKDYIAKIAVADFEQIILHFYAKKVNQEG